MMMRGIILGIMLVSAIGVGVVATPEAEAVGICTVGDIYNNMSKSCSGVVCYGYTGGAWQNCVQIRPTP